MSVLKFFLNLKKGAPVTGIRFKRFLVAGLNIFICILSFGGHCEESKPIKIYGLS